MKKIIKGQVDVFNAFRISLARGAKDNIRIIITLLWIFVYGVIVSCFSKSIGYSLLSSFLIGASINFLSVIPWRIRIFKQARYSYLLFFTTNGFISLILGMTIMWVCIILSLFIFGEIKDIKWLLAHPWYISVYGMVFPVVGIGCMFGENQNSLKKKWEAKTRRNKRLIEQAQEVALRSQINPHFFFNTLNTITSLIPEKPDEAVKAVEKLAEILRPSFNKNISILNSLTDEINVAMAYTEIEKLRFSDSIIIEYSIQPEAEEARIPLLTIQPIVENAFKHGAMKTERKFKILIKAICENESLVIIVKSAADEIFDSIKMENMKIITPQSPHALFNIASRLKIIYDNKASLIALSGEENSGFVQINIPMKI